MAEQHGATWAPRWWRVFLLGLGLWISSVAVAALTGNINMIPTVVLLGSFLVPVSAVVWYLQHDPSDAISARLVLYAFIVGGVTGVLAASLLEAWLLTDGVLVYLSVGLIEEFAKFVALVLVVGRLRHYSVRDGIVMGAAVGFGFAALESSGYAFSALIVGMGGHIYLSLSSLVFTELLRGILAPVGHGLWTAILGGVFFGATARAGRQRISVGVVVTFVLVSLLHALFDSMRGFAAAVAPLSTHQTLAYLAIEIGGLAFVSTLGGIWLWRLWRRPPAVA